MTELEELLRRLIAEREQVPMPRWVLTTAPEQRPIGDRMAARIDSSGEYVEVWVCDPPPPDVLYRVVRDEWSEDYTVRRIYEIDLGPEKTPEQGATAAGVPIPTRPRPSSR